MSALLFPGQGSQVVGMGSEFYNNFSLVKKIFDQADKKLNYPLSKLILEGPENQLQLTQNTQPAILTVSYSIFQVLKNEFNFNIKTLKYFAGHSLGEYSALVCSESLEFDDALYLLHERGKSMQDAVPSNQGAMLAVLGMTVDEVENEINLFKEKGVCEISNDNSNVQIVISGEKKTIDKYNENLKRKEKSRPMLISVNDSKSRQCRSVILTWS